MRLTLTGRGKRRNSAQTRNPQKQEYKASPFEILALCGWEGKQNTIPRNEGREEEGLPTDARKRTVWRSSRRRRSRTVMVAAESCRRGAQSRSGCRRTNRRDKGKVYR